MKKQNLITKLHKPVHPVIGYVVLSGALLVLIGVLYVSYAPHPSSSQQPKITYATPTATLTPIPFDTSTWNTFNDWKGGYSVKLPKTYSAVGLNKAFTEGDPDPSGTGAMHFGENVKYSKDAMYGFSIEFTPSIHTGKQCTTDEECYLNNSNLYSNAKTVHASILGRDIKGIKVSFPPAGEPAEYSVHYYYDFIVHGKPFSVHFYYGDKNPDATQKEPVFQAILSSLSFQNQ